MNNLDDLHKQYLLLIQRMQSGVGAFTTQTYNSVNIKRGVQYEASGFFTIPAETSVDLVYVSGNSPVILKGKEVFFTGEKIKFEVFSDPTYSGGTSLPVYNMTRINPVPSEAILIASPTVTATGTKTQADRVFLGSASLGANVTAAGASEGLEHVFAPNTAYLERITNMNGTSADVSVYLTWYEGELDY